MVGSLVLFAAALILAAGEHGLESRPSAQIMADDCARPLFAQLLRGAHQNAEAAAFIVQEEEHLALLIWPRTRWVRSQNYGGKLPAGTVAIVHTHPAHEPTPSCDDIRESKRLDLPVFVLTRRSIWAVDPDGEPPQRKVEHTGWPDSLPAACGKPRLAR